jgi:hypothetical protein
MFSLKETCLSTAVLGHGKSSVTAGVAPNFVIQRPVFEKGNSFAIVVEKAAVGHPPPRGVRFPSDSHHSANAQHASFGGVYIFRSDSWLVACMLGLHVVRSSSSGIITTIIIQVNCSAIRCRNEMEMIEDEMVLTSSCFYRCVMSMKLKSMDSCFSVAVQRSKFHRFAAGWPLAFVINQLYCNFREIV